jgi:hypothetical protein
MKAKLTPVSGVGDYFVPKWSIGKDILVKRLGVKYTSSENSGSEGLGDEAHTLGLLWYFTTLREKRAHMCGAQV